MIQSNPMIRREFQLEVWTLMIQKSMVVPPSPTVLYNYRYIGGLIAPIARRHFVYCNIYQICSSQLFFHFQKLTCVVKVHILVKCQTVDQRCSKGNYHESRKGSFLFREIITFNDIVPINILRAG